MTVAVAHQASSPARTTALQEGAREASSRGTGLAVLHVVESLDLDIAEAYRSGLREEIETALTAAGADQVAWDLHLTTASDDVADTILTLAREVGAQLLVIGARRRTPIGKFLLGSLTQSLLLQADVPVLVVKGGS